MKNKIFLIASVLAFIAFSAILASAFPSELVSFWRFDNLDDLADSNPGTLQGNARLVDNGIVGRALNTTWNSWDYFNVPDNSNLHLSDDFTFEMFLNPQDYSSGSSPVTFIMGKSFGSSLSTYGNYIFLLVDGKPAFFSAAQCSGNNGYTLMSTEALPKDSWSYVVFTGEKTSSGFKYKVYVNGEIKNEISYSQNCLYLDYGSSPFQIGAPFNFSPWTLLNVFRGRIDEVAIHNKSLNASEILSHYNNVLNGENYFFEPTPVPNFPDITDIKVDVTGSSAKISWKTDINSSSIVFYGLTTGTTLSAIDNSLVTSHVITIAGLSESTSYYFKVSSCNLGNCSTSALGNFTTSSKEKERKVIVKEKVIQKDVFVERGSPEEEEKAPVIKIRGQAIGAEEAKEADFSASYIIFILLLGLISLALILIILILISRKL